MKRLLIIITLISISLLTYSQITESDTIVALGKLNPNSDNMRVWAAKTNVSIIKAINNEDDISNIDSVAYADSSGHANKSDTAIWALGSTTGGGDMFISVYDPTTVSGDAFDMDNMVEGTNLILTSTERTNIGTNTGKISYTDATDVGNNTTHRTSDGSDHSYIDQSVISGSTPTFTNTNFTEATNKNYVTDAEATVIGNTSNTNTGDQTLFTNGDETDQVYTGSQASNIDAGDITNLSNLSNTNTGDQDLSGKQDNITLTTTGSSGASTLIGATLNIPIYTGGGGGDVLKVGTPVNNQVGVWTGDGTIEGTTGLTYSGTALDLTGNITLTGTVDGIDISTDVSANTLKVSYTDGALIDQSVVSGATPTFTNTNFTEATDKNYVSDAQLVVIGNTSNTNTGDQVIAPAWLIADTIVIGSFSKDTTRTTDFYGSFYNSGSDSLVITEMTSVLQGTSPSVTVDIQWHETFNSGSATHLNSTPPTITSTTTGDSDVSFDNAIIPPGVWVWMKTPTVTTPATYISVSISGHRQNAAY